LEVSCSRQVKLQKDHTNGRSSRHKPPVALIVRKRLNCLFQRQLAQALLNDMSAPVDLVGTRDGWNKSYLSFTLTNRVDAPKVILLFQPLASLSHFWGTFKEPHILLSSHVTKDSLLIQFLLLFDIAVNLLAPLRSLFLSFRWNLISSFTTRSFGHTHSTLLPVNEGLGLSLLSAAPNLLKHISAIRGRMAASIASSI
jgi:hypothetical protein